MDSILGGYGRKGGIVPLESDLKAVLIANEICREYDRIISINWSDTVLIVEFQRSPTEWRRYYNGQVDVFRQV